MEIGKHRRPQKVPLSERICDTCNEIEDEVHLITNCRKYENQRNILFSELGEIYPIFSTSNSLDKFIFIMNLDDVNKIQVVKEYFLTIFTHRGSF